MSEIYIRRLEVEGLLLKELRFFLLKKKNGVNLFGDVFIKMSICRKCVVSPLFCRFAEYFTGTFRRKIQWPFRIVVLV